MTFRVPNAWRVRSGRMRSDDGAGNNGAFRLRLRGGKHAFALASDGEGWEHVSVSFPHRCPTWEEMCEVKRIFWSDDDCVVQFHPPRSDYVNVHPYCLHLWRPTSLPMPTPPSWMVGPSGGAA